MNKKKIMHALKCASFTSVGLISFISWVYNLTKFLRDDEIFLASITAGIGIFAAVFIIVMIVEEKEDLND